MKNLLYIKFNMNENEYSFWKDGGTLTDNLPHKVTTFNWNDVLNKSTKFSTFQHLKGDHVEVEISFSEEDLLKIIYEAIS